MDDRRCAWVPFCRISDRTSSERAFVAQGKKQADDWTERAAQTAWKHGDAGNTSKDFCKYTNICLQIEARLFRQDNLCDDGACGSAVSRSRGGNWAIEGQAFHAGGYDLTQWFGWHYPSGANLTTPGIGCLFTQGLRGGVTRGASGGAQSYMKASCEVSTGVE